MVLDIGNKREKGAIDEFMTKTGGQGGEGHNW